MQYTVWGIRIILAIWIFGILFLLIAKIIARSLTAEKMDYSLFLLFPFLLLTKEGRRKIKDNIKQ